MVKKRKGFTLVELLFGATLTALLVFLVLYSTSALVRAWNRASGRLEAESRARASLDFLRRDLESAYFEENGKVWMSAGRDPASRQDGSSVWMQFFTASGNDSEGEPGGLAAVRYSLLSADPVNPDTPQGRLFGFYRVSVGGERTFREFIGQLEGKKKEDFLAAATGTGLEQFFLTSDIAAFEVTFLLPIWDEEMGSWVSIRFTVDETVDFPRVLEGRARRVFPSAAEIRLTVLSREGVALLNELEEGNFAGLQSDEIIRKYGIDIREFVKLRTEGL